MSSKVVVLTVLKIVFFVAAITCFTVIMNLDRQIVLTCSAHVTRLFGSCAQQANVPSWCPEFVKYSRSILNVVHRFRFNCLLITLKSEKLLLFLNTQ